MDSASGMCNYSTSQHAGIVGQSQYNMQQIAQREIQNHQARSSVVIGPTFLFSALAPLVFYSPEFFAPAQSTSLTPAFRANHGINNCTYNKLFILFTFTIVCLSADFHLYSRILLYIVAQMISH